jgi:predicted nucleotidyltransferase
MKQTSDKLILKTIKSTILKLLPDAKVLLFGSKARGDSDRDSDFDIMIITPKSMTLQKRREWEGLIHTTLVNKLVVPIDLMMYSEKEVAIKRELIGHSVRWAMQDGVFL